MFVCLCVGVTSETVSRVVADGARTTKQVAEACGAGSECGRCRKTIRSIIDPTSTSNTRHDSESRV